MSIHDYRLYIIPGWYCVHNNTPEDDKESLCSLAHILHMQMINTEPYLHLHTNAAAEQLVTVLLLITQANSGMTNTAHTSSQ